MPRTSPRRRSKLASITCSPRVRLRAEHDVFRSMRVVRGGECAADHPGDDRRLADLGQVEHVDELAVAQDRRAPAERNTSSILCET